MKLGIFRTFRRYALGILIPPLVGANLATSAPFDAKRYLFLGPALLSSIEGLELSINPPDRRDVVLRPDRPWDSLMLGFYSAV